VVKPHLYLHNVGKIMTLGSVTLLPGNGNTYIRGVIYFVKIARTNVFFCKSHISSSPSKIHVNILTQRATEFGAIACQYSIVLNYSYIQTCFPCNLKFDVFAF
jgi:hypothetical protein